MAGDPRVDLVGRRLRGDPDREAPAQGARTVAAILPNGRVVWLRMDPPLAPAGAVNHLAQLAEQMAERRRAAAQSQSDASTRLSRAVAADAERLSDAHANRANALRRRILAGDHKVDRQLARAAEEHRSRVDRQLRIERETLGRLGRRDLWDKLVIASAFPLFAAYGQPGRPLGANNVTLALTLLIWLVGDEIVDALFGSEEASPYPLNDTDAWSYVAPIGNLLAGWWLLDDFQHERFIAGRVMIPTASFKANRNPAAPLGTPELIYRYTVRIPLSRIVAPAHFPDFETFAGVPVVATISSIRWSAAGASARIIGLSAEVHLGKLTLTVSAVAPDTRASVTDPIPSILEALEVAWIVDTNQPATFTVQS